MEPTAGELIIQMIPAMTLGLIYAALTFVMARKRRINPWPWTIGALIPFIGIIVSAVFFFTTMLSMLDRPNALEDQGGPHTFS